MMDIFNLNGNDTSTSNEQTLAAILQQLQSHDERLNALEQQQAAAQNQIQSALSRGHDDEESPNNNTSINNDEDSRDVLSEDTFTLMMLSPFCSQAWLLGLFTFTFQTVLSVMILTDQLKESVDSSTFNVPFKVDPVVRVGQLFAIIYFMATHDDISTSVRFLVMFWKDPHWDRIIPGRERAIGQTEPEGWVEDTVFLEQNNKKDATIGVGWTMNILVPNLIRFIQGATVNLISFVIIVQSDNIIDLLKDFTALMVLSETDNIFFGLAARGYFGRYLQIKAIQARGIEIKYEVFSSSDLSDTEDNLHAPSKPTGKGFFIRPFILFCHATIMIGSWAYIVMNQINGVYFDQKYPDCKRTIPNAFQLATEHFGDEKCYGGPLNTLECQFEDGDCINFNTAYPLCKGNNRTDAENRVGDGNCDAEFMHADCDYDGGDCCPYEIINDPSFGDGICDEAMNTEGCWYDNGDCIDFNRDFAGCPLNVVFNNPTFGDGQCNGGIPSTAMCGYDNGDCNQLRIAHPDCPFEDFSNMTGADDVILGDGICDGNIYNVEECGFEYGDCNQGQVGQSIMIPDGGSLDVDDLYLSKEFSLDGSTVAVGLFRSNEDGQFNLNAPGVVKIWRFHNDRKLWFPLGENISGYGDDSYGERLSMSTNGNHLAISSRSGLRVFGFNNTSGDEEWSQVGQTLKSIFTDFSYSYGIISADGLRIALVYHINLIWIYNLESNRFSGQTWRHDDDLDVIEVDDIGSIEDVQLRFASSNGSTLLFTHFFSDFVKAFRQTSPDIAWAQMGQDIEKAPLSSSMAIGANGTMIAVHRHYADTSDTSSSGHDEVQVLNYDGSEWQPLREPIVNPSPNDEQQFGYSIEMSADGNSLLIGLNHAGCRHTRPEIVNPNRFVTDLCTLSSRASYNLYTYDRSNNQFVSTPLRDGVEDANNIISDDRRILHGLHFSMGNSKNGTNLLSVSNYDIDNEVSFVDVIDLDELYLMNCVVEQPEYIGNGKCQDYSPYNSPECGFDGGDCERNQVDGYPNCFINRPSDIGNGICNPWFNTTACGFDGGDCEGKEPTDDGPPVGSPDDGPPGKGPPGKGPPGKGPPGKGPPVGNKPVDGYPDCFVTNPDKIGDGKCDGRPYDSSKCGFDGGDCEPPNRSAAVLDGIP